MIQKGRYTATHSDLYYVVHKVHYVGPDKDYVKLKATVKYKSNHEVCQWLCPYGWPKNFKLIKSVVENWERV